MRSLHDLASLLEADDGWEDERTIVGALYRELDSEVPPFLTSATGDWKEPYLTLQLAHSDGTVLSVMQGDGYTEFVTLGVEYGGYLDAVSLIDLLRGALHGRTSYVRHTRFGYGVRHHFEVAGREGERLGSGQPQLGLVPLLLGLMPFLPDSVQKRRLSFERTPLSL